MPNLHLFASEQNGQKNIAKTGHSGHLNSTYSRTFKIGKGWIASGFRPRNDMKNFRPNVLLKDTEQNHLSCKITSVKTFAI
jgi:hypothetical protein